MFLVFLTPHHHPGPVLPTPCKSQTHNALKACPLPPDCLHGHSPMLSWHWLSPNTPRQPSRRAHALPWVQLQQGCTMPPLPCQPHTPWPHRPWPGCVPPPNSTSSIPNTTSNPTESSSPAFNTPARSHTNRSPAQPPFTCHPPLPQCFPVGASTFSPLTCPGVC